MHNPQTPFYSIIEFQKALKNGQIIDAQKGGLVIGRSHADGNIYLVRENRFGYDTFANMEGGEFIVCNSAYWANKNEIDSINSEFVVGDFFVNAPQNCKRIIDTRDSPEDKYLYIGHEDGGVFIVNKYATYKYIDRLQSINS